MKYTTLLTYQPDSLWRAVVPGLPDCTAEAATRAEVLVKIQERIAETVSYTEVVQVEVPVSLKTTNGVPAEHAGSTPWHWFGAFQKDAQWGELFEEVEEQRDAQLMGE